MTQAEPVARSLTLPRTTTLVDIVVPAYNEAHIIEWSIKTLHEHLTSKADFDWRITVVDNGSTDGTALVARRVAADLAGVAVVRLERKGRGGALRAAWSESRADVVAYMDADLSTDLNAIAPLVEAVVSGRGEIAIGSRVAPGAQLERRARREILSRGYNVLVRFALGAGFGDAQCGFKALDAKAARALLPLVDDNGWFFDTEILVTAQRSGLSIVEVPVRWTDDLDSRVEVASTVANDIRGICRLVRHRRRLSAVDA